jgi:hypothetical protein
VLSPKIRLLARVVAPFFAAGAAMSPAPAIAADPACVRMITIMENLYSAEKAKLANDKCQFLRMAAANRAAMLNEIHRYPNSCGFEPSIIASIQRQRFFATAGQASACR